VRGQRDVRDLPAVIALGVSTGLQAGLLALGLVLIYRANRFINFAQGQLGSIASAGLAVLVFRFHAPYGIALVVALVAGGASGAVVERLLGWRLFDKSRLVLLVATIGVAQLILLLVLAGPLKVDPGTLAVRGYPQPFNLRWTIGSAVLNSSQVLTILVAPVIAVGLYLFLARTKTGRAIRGAASNPDAARLAGISVRRVSLTVWVIAGLVSSVAAILYAPSQPAIGFGDSGPGLLLRGLAAALLARMFDFRIAVLAAIALGIVEHATIFYTDVAGLTDLVLALSLAAGLLLRARALAGDVRRDEGLVVERSTPPLPERLKGAFFVRHAGVIGWVGLFALIGVAPLLPGLGTQERALFLVLMIAFAMTGMALTVLTGWGGQVSLGQFAFVGLGAYVATRADGLGVVAMLLVCGLVTAAASALVGSVAVRFRGLFLGVVTLAFAFAARSWLFRQGIFVHDSSAIVRIERPFLFGLEIQTVRAVYAIGVVALALTALSLHSLRRSPIGRAIIASRDNDDLAAAHGVSPRTAKLIGLGVAGFVTGVAGGLWGMGVGSWSFAAFDPSMSFVLLSAAIVGGIGTLYGPILGVIAVFAWPYLVPGANTIAVRSFTSGALLLVTLLFFPGGLASLVQDLRRWAVARLAGGVEPETADDEQVDVVAPPPAAAAPTVVADRARALEAVGISIAFGGIQALDDASVHVEPGEIVGLIGGNGAGKSTLLGCISGHLRADAGEVWVSGQEVTGLAPEARSALGLRRTFQDARLFPGLTLAETVTVAADGAEPGGVVGAMTASPWLRRSERLKSERAADVLAEFGLADRAGTLAGELSTGMRRVCDLAAVAAAEPTIVLLDEPTAGLAQREVEAFAPLLRAMRDRYGASVLLVEHDVPLMMTLCDRIYCLESGRVIAEGTPEEIRADPAVIASYLGTAVGPKPRRRAARKAKAS
jgi:ABC-type branched-subunit amino acid transport system ATPase component/ABC-type branched-subunit amino acid transport system permease subunit